MSAKAKLKLQQARRAQASKAVQHIKKENDLLAEALPLFKDGLEDFATKKKKAINQDPEFRMQFLEMCSTLGVDPVASKCNKFGSKLGLNDFYFEIAIQAIDECLYSRSTDGGLTSLAVLTDRLRRRRGSKASKISRKDVEKAVKVMQPLGPGFHIVRIGKNNDKYVSSVPEEVNPDFSKAMDIAAENGGSLSGNVLSKQHSWSDHRIKAVNDFFLGNGMAWNDNKAQSQTIVFPSIFFSQDTNELTTTTSTVASGSQQRL